MEIKINEIFMPRKEKAWTNWHQQSLNEWKQIVRTNLIRTIGLYDWQSFCWKKKNNIFVQVFKD